MSSLKPFSDVEVNQIKGNIERSEVNINIVCIVNFCVNFLNIIFIL